MQPPCLAARAQSQAKKLWAGEEALNDDGGGSCGYELQFQTVYCLSFLPFFLSISNVESPPPPPPRAATTHIPTERDGSVTIGKQRLLVTENALRCESGRQSGGEEVVGLHRTWTERAHNRFLPPAAVKSVQIYKASRNTANRPPACRTPTAPDLKIFLNLLGRLGVRGQGDEK